MGPVDAANAPWLSGLLVKGSSQALHLGNSLRELDVHMGLLVEKFGYIMDCTAYRALIHPLEIAEEGHLSTGSEVPQCKAELKKLKK